MLEYLNRYQAYIDRLELVRLDSYHGRPLMLHFTFADRDHLQLRGVIRGLSYLHKHQVVHGDLKGVRTAPFSSHTAR